MRLGYNTNGLQNHRLDDALRLIADHGFQAVALTPDVGHLDPYHCTAAEVERIAALLQQLGLTCVIETGARFVIDPTAKHEPSLMTRGDDARRRRLDYYARCARLGRDLGAGVLSFWAGVDRSPGPDSAAWLDAGVLATCELARAHALAPALEPEPAMAIETVAQWTALRERTGTAGPALCLDVGHLYVTGEGEPAAVIAMHARDLAQVHLEDVRRGVHEHLVPGDGELDLGAVRSALEQHGYRGTACFELSRSSHEAPGAMARCLDAWGPFLR